MSCLVNNNYYIIYNNNHNNVLHSIQYPYQYIIFTGNSATACQDVKSDVFYVLRCAKPVAASVSAGDTKWPKNAAMPSAYAPLQTGRVPYTLH